jgi:ribosomal protein L3 glutamine methyltransferase
MATPSLDLSQNPERNETYHAVLARSRKGELSIDEISRIGHQLMRKAKLHHHFFAQHSLFMNAAYLAFYALQIPWDYNNLLQNQQYFDKKVSEQEAQKIIELFEKRISARIPVEYITHEAFYLGRKFYVNEHVLVPRSLMNTRFNDFLAAMQWQNYRVLDLCTGSGCIGITLALMDAKLKVDLADISEDALAVAKINIDRYSLHDRVRCIQSDLFQNIDQTYDLIITNPPYVSAREYQAAPEEFKNEPALALLAGKEGLDLIERILREAKRYLNPEGVLIAEVGYTVAKHLKKKYRKLPLQWYNYRNPEGKISWLDRLSTWTGYLDSILYCKASGLKN